MDSPAPDVDDVPVAAADPTDDFVVSVFARHCASRATLEDIAGKWGILALLALRESDYRFNMLRRRVDGVSEKMLSQTLQTLERDGMLTRAVRTTIPPRVEYSLTQLGTRVADQLQGLAQLMEGTVGEVDQARRAYDARQVRS